MHSQGAASGPTPTLTKVPASENSDDKSRTWLLPVDCATAFRQARSAGVGDNVAEGVGDNVAEPVSSTHADNKVPKITQEASLSVVFISIPFLGLMESFW